MSMSSKTIKRLALAKTLIDAGSTARDAAKRVGWSSSTLGTYLTKDRKRSKLVVPAKKVEIHRFDEKPTLSLRLTGKPDEIAAFLRGVGGG